MFVTSSEIGHYLTRSAGKSHHTILVLVQELEDMIYKLENEKEKDIIIDHRFYRNIIGSKGDNIREIREMFNQVQITFPGQGKLFLGALPCCSDSFVSHFLMNILILSTDETEVMIKHNCHFFLTSHFW